MLSSLRARVLVWYTALLAVVIAVFVATVAVLAWRARLDEVDAALETRAAALSAALEAAPDGTFDLTLPGAGQPEPAAGSGPALYHVAWTSAGALIDRSDPALDVPPPAAPGVRTRAGRRELTVPAAAGASVLVGRSLADARADVWALAGQLGSIGLGAVLVAFGGGWFLVGRALAPVDRISRTARAMSAGDLNARIPLSELETELEHLARALNEAFDRLHDAVERQKQFTADASHELRTPLATLSTEIQWSLARPREPAAYRESLDVCRRAVDRMTAIVERLLALARAGADTGRRELEPIDLDALVARVVADVAPLAAARSVTLEHAPAGVCVRGEPARLGEALTNVVVNAIQYNREGGTVTIGAAEAGGHVDLTVRDTGIGIAPADLERVFEPFFRADPARSRDAGGAGLGLPVAETIVQQHGGRITCVSQPGAGTTVAIRLPVAAHALEAERPEGRASARP